MSKGILESKHIELAISRISKHGDTDIFPLFSQIKELRENPSKYYDEIIELDSNFQEVIGDIKRASIKCLVPHNTCFRIATKIDLTLTIYYLALAIQIFESVNEKREKLIDGVVYSHRYKPDIKKGFLFASDSNWKAFKSESAKMFDNKNQIIVSTDIQTFYDSISFGVVKDSLEILDVKKDEIERTLTLLELFQIESMKGLPIGGDASRLISELVLLRVDEKLLEKGIKYKRYVDDFHIRAESKNRTYEIINLLGHTLYKEAGLTLNNNKLAYWKKSSYIVYINSVFNLQRKYSSNKHIQDYYNLCILFDNYLINEPLNDFSDIDQSDLFNLLMHHTKKEMKHDELNQSMVKIILNALKITNQNTTETIIETFLFDVKKTKSVFNFIIKAIIANSYKINTETLYNFHIQFNKLYHYDGDFFSNEFNIGNYILFLRLIKRKNIDDKVLKLQNRNVNSDYVKLCCAEYFKSNVRIVELDS